MSKDDIMREANQALRDVLVKAYDEGYEKGGAESTLLSTATFLRSNALFKVRDMLFPEFKPGTDLTTEDGINAVVGAVRVLVAESRQFEQRMNGLQADNNQVKAQRDESRRVAEKNAKLVYALELEVSHLKEALQYQYTRGYRAAVREVTKAATKLQAEAAVEVAKGER